MKKHGEITLAIDIMFNKKIPFVMTMSRNTLWNHITNQRYEKQYTGNINQASNTSISGTWIQDKGNISRWTIQTYTTNNQTKRNYTQYMHRQ